MTLIPAEDDGQLWLECVERDVVASGFLGRLRSFFGQDRRLLLTREELAA